jgi:hypothetical protein
VLPENPIEYIPIPDAKKHKQYHRIFKKITIKKRPKIIFVSSVSPVSSTSTISSVSPVSSTSTISSVSPVSSTSTISSFYDNTKKNNNKLGGKSKKKLEIIKVNVHVNIIRLHRIFTFHNFIEMIK